ncbi:MAG: hypothetical protein SNI70_12495 [Rikenellaceae bacterium]
MNITGTTITTKAEATTENARYQLEYLVQDKSLIRVEASVSSLDDEPQGLGYIIYDGGNIHCSLPGDRQNSNYFEDFEVFLSSIKEECEEDEPITDQETQTSNK